jgi:hypothetical protein
MIGQNMFGQKYAHVIFLIILILATAAIFLIFRPGTEGFGVNEIIPIEFAEYGEGKNNGAKPGTPLVPMDPKPGYYAINVGTVNAPVWKQKAVPYGYKVDPENKTKLIGKTDSAIKSANPELDDADFLAPPFLQIPGATYTGSNPDYGLNKKPPASGYYKIQVTEGATTKYFMKRTPNDYVADRKDLLEDNVNPGTTPGSKKYTKMIFRAPEIPESEISSTMGATKLNSSAEFTGTFNDGYFIINDGGTYYKKLIPNGYDISSNNPVEVEYKNIPDVGKHTPLKYNPNFTPTRVLDTDISYNANNIDMKYRDDKDMVDINIGKYWMFDSEGKLVEVNTEAQKTPILYYIPGAYKFGASNYVPNYEDSVFLSRTTRQSQLAPVTNTASQLGGFCSQYEGNTAKLEEKCAAQDLNACASTSCCVLLGGQKCVAGNQNGPKNPANYTDYNLKNRDFYYYQGKCYGNCL